MHQRRRSRGFSLIEIAMVLAIIAFMIAGVMLFFGSGNNSEHTNEAMEELANIQQATHSIYNGQSSFDGVSATVLGQSTQIPSKWVIGGVQSAQGLRNPFGGAVTVSSTNSGATFQVQFSGLTADACSKMVTQDFGTSLNSVTAGSSSAQGRSLTPTEAQQGCGTTNNATASWTFY